MANPAKVSRSVVIRTSRETLALALAACAVAFALAYAVHSRPDVSNVGVPKPRVVSLTPAASTHEVSAGASSTKGEPLRDWTGHLAEVAPATATVPAEPMTSASLVVSPSQLPPVTSPARPIGKRPCETSSSCTTKATASTLPPVPPSRPSPDASRPAIAATVRATQAEPGWPAKINPFNHLPDTATLKQPFTYVGDKVAGWFK